MNDKKQIFQTNTQKRWKTFQWSTRLFIFIIILLIPIFIITLKKGLKPSLPLLGNNVKQEKNISNPVTPLELSAKELKKYKGFDYFLRGKQKIKKNQY